MKKNIFTCKRQSEVDKIRIMFPFFLCLIFICYTVSGQFTPSRPAGSTPTGVPKINFRLFAVGITNPVDGSVIVFDNAYSNFVDGNDALKLVTSGENFGILRNDTILVVEGRNVVSNQDTITFILWNLAKKDYRIDFIPQDLNPGLTAILVDSFLNTSEPLNLSGGTVSKTFTVTNDPASGGVVPVNRFAILFAQIPPLPVRFVSISANRKGTDVEVGWIVAEEQGIAKYEILRSADGINFVATGSVNATSTTNYSWTDKAALTGNSFYRIKAISIDGKVKYTNIAKVFAGNIKPEISVYPNPVQAGQMNLQFVNQPKGRFDLQLVNDAGQVVYKGYAQHPGGNNVQFVDLPSAVRGGLYRLVITSSGKVKTVQNLFIHTTK